MLSSKKKTMEWSFEEDSAEDDLEKTLEIRQVAVLLSFCLSVYVCALFHETCLPVSKVVNQCNRNLNV